LILEATLDDLFSSPSAVGDHNTIIEEHLPQSTSLLGGANSPPVPPGANDPGLEDAGSFGAKMKKHWLWIVLGILLLVFGFWYFGGTGSPA
jgi:hypothetical protein